MRNFPSFPRSFYFVQWSAITVTFQELSSRCKNKMLLICKGFLYNVNYFSVALKIRVILRITLKHNTKEDIDFAWGHSLGGSRIHLCVNSLQSLLVIRFDMIFGLFLAVIRLIENYSRESNIIYLCTDIMRVFAIALTEKLKVQLFSYFQ